MHTPASPFGNLDIILYGDLCQAQTICDCWIFEQPHLKGTSAPYNFWKENVKTCELKQVMGQENKEFVSILNRIRTRSNIDDDLVHIIAFASLFPCMLTNSK